MTPETPVSIGDPTYKKLCDFWSKFGVELPEGVIDERKREKKDGFSISIDPVWGFFAWPYLNGHLDDINFPGRGSSVLKRCRDELLPKIGRNCGDEAAWGHIARWIGEEEERLGYWTYIESACQEWIENQEIWHHDRSMEELFDFVDYIHQHRNAGIGWNIRIEDAFFKSHFYVNEKKELRSATLLWRRSRSDRPFRYLRAKFSSGRLEELTDRQNFGDPGKVAALMAAAEITDVVPYKFQRILEVFQGGARGGEFYWYQGTRRGVEGRVVGEFGAGDLSVAEISERLRNLQLVYN